MEKGVTEVRGTHACSSEFGVLSSEFEVLNFP